MKLYNITYKDHSAFDDGTCSFQMVSKNYIDFEKAHKLAIKYIITEHGVSKDYIDPNDIEVIVNETYEIDEVDGYKIKLVKE